MADLLKASVALDALMEGRTFVSVNSPEAKSFRRAVKAAQTDSAPADTPHNTEQTPEAVTEPAQENR